MSAELICSTLGLPADRWPPDHYELLGLPRGTADASRVEAHVLDRMERLRKLQLTHPDAVTDAMNRLAQALVCLTDPKLKREYDASFGMAGDGTARAFGVSEAGKEAPNAPATRAMAPDRVSGAFSASDLAPVEAAPSSVAGVTGPGPRVLRTRGPSSLRPATEATPEPPSRRALYRQRATLRQLRTTWNAIGRNLADADRPFASRAELVELIQDLGRVGLLTADDASPLSGELGQPGSLILALTRQPILATRLHDLSPTYRRALAGDWAAADARLLAAQDNLRRELAPPTLRSWRRRLRRLGRWALVEHLDLTLVLTGLAALGVALIRAR